jgi:hypothetical protein
MEQLLGELLVEVRSLKATSTELAAHVRSGIVNNVLEVRLATFPASGIITRSYPTPYGSVQVTNHSDANPIIVSADPAQATAPAGGGGTSRVDAGTSRLVDLHGRALTLYGTDGDNVSFQVFTRAWPPF